MRLYICISYHCISAASCHLVIVLITTAIASLVISVSEFWPVFVVSIGDVASMHLQSGCMLGTWRTSKKFSFTVCQWCNPSSTERQRRWCLLIVCFFLCLHASIYVCISYHCTSPASCHLVIVVITTAIASLVISVSEIWPVFVASIRDLASMHLQSGCMLGTWRTSKKFSFTVCQWCNSSSTELGSIASIKAIASMRIYSDYHGFQYAHVY